MDESKRTFTVDHVVSVSLSADQLTASLSLSDDQDQPEYTMEQLKDLLGAHSIQYGIDDNLLAEFVNDPRQFVNPNNLVVASGDAAQDGEDGYIHLLIDLDSDTKKPHQTVDGKIDYKDVIQLSNVHKGQRIAEKVAAKEGIAGRSVTGKQLLAKKGKEASFKIGKNVVVDTEQKALYAAIDGLVSRTANHIINVFPIFEVDGDLDYNIGNIDFVGTVVIRGNVLPGFKINAAGDIRITGGVEGAQLIATGSIEITDGILGQSKGLVKAGKDVRSSFIQDGNVEAGGNVIVSRSIMHSHIRAGHQVLCNGQNGLIVGGTVQAGEKVSARIIGNAMSTATTVEVGVLPQLRNELVQLKEELNTHSDNMDKTMKALSFLEQLAAKGQLGSDKIVMRIKLNNTRKQTIEEQNVVLQRILELEQSAEASCAATIEVLSTVYSGTKIVIDQHIRFIKDSTKGVTFLLSDNEIVMRS